MNHLNSILIEGNVTNNPELIKQDEKSICKLSIASDRYYPKGKVYEKEVSFFIIITEGKLAETCAAFALKGRGIRVVGRLKQEESGIEIIADHVEFKPNVKINEKGNIE